MALNLPVEQDLTFIFESDDVRDAFAGHCARTHLDDDSVRDCTYCQQLRTVLAVAITEWLALVDQDRAAAHGRGQGWQPIALFVEQKPEDGPFVVHWADAGPDMVAGWAEYAQILEYGERPATHWIRLTRPPLSEDTPT